MKFLFKLAIVLAVCYQTNPTFCMERQPFTPLEEAEYPHSTLCLQSVQTNTIEARLFGELPQMEHSVPLLADIVEVTQITHEFGFNFKPYSWQPGLMVPSGFPLDANDVILKYLGKSHLPSEELKKGEKFGIMNGKAVIGDHQVGHWESELAETPRTLMIKLNLGLGRLQNQALGMVCAKNPTLMEAAERHLDQNQRAEDINTAEVIGLCHLLAYCFAGSVEENPSKDVALSIRFPMCNNFNLAVSGHKNLNALKGSIREAFRDVVRNLGLDFDPENKTFSMTVI